MGMTGIWERLYLGSLKDAAQLAAENQFGITSAVPLYSHNPAHAKRGQPRSCPDSPTLTPSRHGTFADEARPAIRAGPVTRPADSASISVAYEYATKILAQIT
jgi:hypothetical protein